MPSSAAPRVRQRALWGLLLLASILALSPASGQGFEPFGVAMTSDEADLPTSGECVTFAAAVENTGQSPIPQQHRIALTFSAAPPGWTLNEPTQRQFTLAPGASADFEFQLCPGTDLQAGDIGDVTVTATALDDVRDPPASASARFSATYETEGLFGFDLPDAALYVAIAAVLGLLGVVLLTRRRPSAGIVIHCPEPAKEVLPNRGTSFPIRIRNEGRARDVVTLSTSPVPRGWDTFLPLVDIPLEPREEQTVWLSVKSPPDAQAGDHVVVKIIARSAAGGVESAQIDTLTTVREAEGPPAAEPSTPSGPQPVTLEELDEEPEERSVYGPEDRDEETGASGRPVAVKRRRSA